MCVIRFPLLFGMCSPLIHDMVGTQSGNVSELKDRLQRVLTWKQAVLSHDRHMLRACLSVVSHVQNRLLQHQSPPSSSSSELTLAILASMRHTYRRHYTLPMWWARLYLDLHLFTLTLRFSVVDRAAAKKGIQCLSSFLVRCLCVCFSHCFMGHTQRGVDVSR